MVLSLVMHTNSVGKTVQGSKFAQHMNAPFACIFLPLVGAALA